MSKMQSRIVLTTPREGEWIGRTVTVSGLSDTFEARVCVRVKDTWGTVLAEAHGTGGTLGNPKPFAVELQLQDAPHTLEGIVEAFELDMRDGQEKEKCMVKVHFGSN